VSPTGDNKSQPPCPTDSRHILYDLWASLFDLEDDLAANTIGKKRERCRGKVLRSLQDSSLDSVFSSVSCYFFVKSSMSSRDAMNLYFMYRRHIFCTLYGAVDF
jgi:hypothetical protein